MITASDAGTVQVFDQATQELVLLVTRGFDRTMTDHFQRVGAGSRTACGLALKSGERTFFDFDGDPDVACVMHVEAGYHSAQATPLVSRSGRPIGMLNTHWHAPHHRPDARQLRSLDLLARQMADLIEQRQAHEALRFNEERLRAVAENLTGGAVFVVDGDLRYQLAAGEALATAGFRADELVGRSVNAAMGAELAAIYTPNYRRALAGEPFEHEHEAHGRIFQSRGRPLRGRRRQRGGGDRHLLRRHRVAPSRAGAGAATAATGTSHP